LAGSRRERASWSDTDLSTGEHGVVDVAFLAEFGAEHTSETVVLTGGVFVASESFESAGRRTAVSFATELDHRLVDRNGIRAVTVSDVDRPDRPVVKVERARLAQIYKK